jgi:hypothetical protein
MTISYSPFNMRGSGSVIGSDVALHSRGRKSSDSKTTRPSCVLFFFFFTFNSLYLRALQHWSAVFPAKHRRHGILQKGGQFRDPMYMFFWAFFNRKPKWRILFFWNSLVYHNLNETLTQFLVFEKSLQIKQWNYGHFNFIFKTIFIFIFYYYYFLFLLESINYEIMASG